MLMAKRIQTCRQGTKYTLTLRWTAGHEGVEGNELADREAKMAANGTSSAKHLLPPYLQKSLPINPAAARREHTDKLKKAWTETWKKSSRGRKAAHLDESTPSVKFINMISNKDISRKAASRITQLRIGHTPLNQYLKHIGKIDSTRCPACGANKETIEHYTLACPSHAYERLALSRQAIKISKHLTMKTLLGKQEMAVALAKYIVATQRFKDSGERNKT